MRIVKPYQFIAIGVMAVGVAFLLSCGTKDPVSSEETIPPGKIIFVKNDTINGYGIYSMDAGGGNQKRILDTNDDEMIPDCSCAGDKIVFIWNIADKTQIFTINMQGADPQQITDMSETVFCPRWSPGDSMIAFHRYSGTPPNGNYNIWVLVLDRDTLIQITNDSAMDVSPSWSPDGTGLVFASNRDGDYDIYYVEVGTGADPVKLTNDTVSNDSPQFSHNGEWIVYISPDADIVESDPEVFKMRADGSDVTQLTHNEFDDFSPCWSPDDSWIAYRSRVTGPARYDICRIRANGTGETNITDNLDNDAWPDWTN